jgi:hypothetical protein
VLLDRRAGARLHAIAVTSAQIAPGALLYRERLRLTQATGLVSVIRFVGLHETVIA